jgi:hypothetical protein
MYHNQGFPNAFAYQNQRRNGEEAAAGNEENNGKSVSSGAKGSALKIAK